MPLSSYPQTAHNHQVKTAVRFHKVHTVHHMYLLFLLCRIYPQDRQKSVHQAVFPLFLSFQEYQVYHKRYRQEHELRRCVRQDRYYIRRAYIYVSFFLYSCLYFILQGCHIILASQPESQRLLHDAGGVDFFLLLCSQAFCSYKRHFRPHTAYLSEMLLFRLILRMNRMLLSRFL